MAADSRWAARYQFVEELWRGLDRLIYDARLRAARPRDEQLEDLLAVIAGADDDASVSLIAREPRELSDLADLAEQFGAKDRTTTTSLEDATKRVGELPWSIALVDIDDAESDREDLTAFLDALGEQLDPDASGDAAGRKTL